MAFEPTKHVKVACTAFSHGFLKDLAEVWREHGRNTMLHTAKTNRPRSSKLRTNARFIRGKLHVAP
jgi:hypothetical protein